MDIDRSADRRLFIGCLTVSAVVTPAATAAVVILCRHRTILALLLVPSTAVLGIISIGMAVVGITGLIRMGR